MENSKDDIIKLWRLYIENKANPAEKAALMNYLIQDANQEENITYLQEALHASPANPVWIDPERRDDILEEVIASVNKVPAKLINIAANQKLTNADPATRRIPFFKTALFRNIAAVVIIVSAALLIWMQQNKEQVFQGNKALLTDIHPGKPGAVLTLADGRELTLDSLQDGVIAQQNGSEIRLNNGAMHYQLAPENSQEMAYNSLSTPVGRQYQFSLPDGTKVWLNAASSIKYPTAFIGNDRTVAIQGEVYFEVVANKKKPFIVKVGEAAAVEVLGTSFNIKAYANEAAISTTVIEGAVKVQNTNKNLPVSTKKELVLLYGQQALVLLPPTPSITTIEKQNPGVVLSENVDIDKVIAWKKGLFNFEGATLVEVMKELERWYDIEVVYEGTPPTISFVGKMQKDLTFKDMLDVLVKSNVKFTLDGRKLIIKAQI